MVCSNAFVSNASSPAWFGEFLFETNATARFHYIIGKKKILAWNIIHIHNVKNWQIYSPHKKEIFRQINNLVISSVLLQLKRFFHEIFVIACKRRFP